MVRDPTGPLKTRLAALPSRLQAGVVAALDGIGDAMVEEARRRLAAGTGSGPSQPGAPPHDPTGRLATSISSALDDGGTAVIVTAAAPYAAFLEFGTRTMAARPFLRLAGEAVRPAAAEACRAALGEAAEDRSP